MTREPGKPSTDSAGPSREARLAEALRANLRRRKDQARARAADDADADADRDGDGDGDGINAATDPATRDTPQDKD